MASRSNNSIKNIFNSFSTKILMQLIHFVVRTVFIHCLGVSYNGLDGLFTDILTMMSLADLGIGVAMTHSYYGPLANKDEQGLANLTRLYSKVYGVIGMVVFAVGMGIMPFLPKIITDVDKTNAVGINIYFIFFWYILNSAVSYIFSAYKQSLIIADQKQYVIKNAQLWFTAVASALQIIFLLAFKGQNFGYYTYLITNIVFQIARNLYISKKCDKMYPFLKTASKEKQGSGKIKKLFKDVYALFLYRICIVIMNSTDNIIITSFVTDGLIGVGSYRNYTFLIGAVREILVQTFDAIRASVGNMISEIKNKVREYETFNALYFAAFWLFGMCAVVLWVMLDPFARFWLEKTDVVYLDKITIFVLIANFYVAGLVEVTRAFREAYGIFQQGKYRPVFMAVLNIGLSIWLVQDYGMTGVFMGSLLSRLLTIAWYDTYIVHKHGFMMSIKPYLIKYFLRIILLISMGYVIETVVNLFPSTNLPWLILRGIVATVIANGILLAIYCRSKEFDFIFTRIKKIVLSKKKGLIL